MSSYQKLDTLEYLYSIHQRSDLQSEIPNILVIFLTNWQLTRSYKLIIKHINLTQCYLYQLILILFCRLNFVMAVTD